MNQLFSSVRGSARAGAVATLLLLVAGVAAPARAQSSVAGTIHNATSGKPQAGVTVTLLSLQSGMQPVGHTVSDSAGNFRIGGAPGGGAPLMLQADFDGVPYFQPLTPGQAQGVKVDVYQSSADESKIQLSAEIAVLQPEQGQLAVVDEYRAENQLAPPKTLYRAGGLFRFRVPSGAQVDGARVIGPSGMPVDSVPGKTAEPNIYRVDFPLRPGETKIQVSYRIPYPGLKASLSETPLYPTGQYEVYLPTPMTLSAPGFNKLGNEQGYNVYGPSAPSPAGLAIAYQIAGDAPVPTDAGADGTGAGAGAAGASAPPSAPAAAPEAAPTADVAPPASKTFLERNLWTLLALLGLGAAAGFGFMLSEPRTVGAPSAPGAAAVVLGTSVPPVPAPAVGDAGFERLKNDLFMLELRRHTANVDEAEYQRLRAEIDERMRRMVGA